MTMTKKTERDDHDLLIAMETKLDSLIEDIRDLKDGTSKIVGDHEARIRKMEDRQLTWVGALAMLQFFIGIVLWFISNQ